MLQHTFTWQGVNITVHARTGFDELDADTIIFKMGVADDDTARYRAGVFARIVTQTDAIEGDLGFELPKATADADTLEQAMTALLGKTGGLVRAWRNGLNQVDAPPGDTTLYDEAVNDPKQKKRGGG